MKKMNVSILTIILVFAFTMGVYPEDVSKEKGIFLKEIKGEYGIVARVNVPYVEEGIEWYEKKLGLKNDHRYYVKGVWAQLNFPGIKNFALGISEGIPNPAPKAYVITIVVDNIERAHKKLKKEGVNVGEIIDVGRGVKLAYFTDLVGNALALRQNAAKHPKASSLGEH